MEVLIWIVGRSIVLAKSHAKSARLKKERMDSVVVVIRTTMTCNYNSSVANEVRCRK